MKRLWAWIVSIIVAVMPICVLLMPATPVKATGDWYDEDYLYRDQITINGTAAVNDYTLGMLVVHAGTGTDSPGHVYLQGHTTTTDFSDIAFTDNDLVTRIPHYVEQYSSNDTAYVWVKVPSIPASPSTTNITIYYNAVGQPNYSSGYETWLKFDDFAGASINTTTWTVDNWSDKATADTISSGKLDIYDKQNAYNHLQTTINANSFRVRGQIGVVSSQSGGVWGPELRLWWNDTSNGNNFCWGNDYNNTNQYGMKVINGAITEIYVAGTGNTSMNYHEIRVTTTNITCWYSMATNGTAYQLISTQAYPAQYSGNCSLWAIGKGVHYYPDGYANAEFNNAFGTLGNLAHSYFDNVMYGYYVSPEPAFAGTSGEQPLAGIVPPTITTSAADNITAYSADLHGTVDNDGGEDLTNVGFYWGTPSGNLTHSSNESGTFDITDTFTYTINALSPNTTYYWKAWGQNSAGVGNSTETSFTTLLVAPLPPTNVTWAQTAGSTATVNWTMGYLAQTTLIRAKQDAYPDSIYDGFQVYNDANNTTDMTGLDLVTGSYYLSLWSHNSIGYSANYSTVLVEGKGMAGLNESFTMLALLVLAAILSWSAVSTNNFLLAVISSAAWFANLIFVKDNPPAGIVAASQTHQFLMIALGVAGVGIIIAVVARSYFRRGGGLSNGNGGPYNGPKWAHWVDSGTRVPRGRSGPETSAEYQARLERLSRRNGR